MAQGDSSANGACSQRELIPLQRARAAEIVLLARADHCKRFFRADVGKNGNQALRAQCHCTDRLVVVSGPDEKVVGAGFYRLCDFCRAAARFLDTLNVRVL